MTPATWTFLVLVVLALAVATAWRRRTPPPSARRPSGARPSLSAPDDDLRSLGLSEVRPAGSSRPDGVRPEGPRLDGPRPVARRAEPPPEPEPEPETAAEWDDDGPSWTFDTTSAPGPAAAPAAEDEAAPSVDDTLSALLGEARPADEVDATPVTDADAERPPSHAAPLTSVRPAPAYVASGSPLWVAPGPPEHLLASLAACIGGTVAVLRRTAGGAYVVDALAGLDLPAPPAPLTAAGAHPLDRAPLDRYLSVLDGDDLGALAYLPAGTARSALIRALDETPEPRVLVAVTLGVDAERVDPDTARLVGDYVDLLATLRADAPAADEASDDETSPEADRNGAEAAPQPEASAATMAATVATSHVEAGGRAPAGLPRSVILAGEIADARETRRPLAFALVTRADADAVLADEARTTSAEADLAARLRAAPRVRRVERFGALVFGVFLDATPDQVAPWARALSGKGDALRVGAVAPAGGSADAVREMATLALEEAYAQGTVCVVTD